MMPNIKYNNKKIGKAEGWLVISRYFTVTSICSLMLHFNQKKKKKIKNKKK